MSEEAEKLELLRERARKLAARRVRAAGRVLHERVVLVVIAGERYGIAAARLREVMRAAPITPLPGLPHFMPGMACVRGELVSVLDVRALRNRGTGASAPFFAVIEQGSRALALLADEVLGLEDVFEDELRDPLLTASARTDFIRAVTKDLVQLLDVAALFSSPRILVGFEAPHAAREVGERGEP